MELIGHYVFDAPVERVWDLLMDPKTIASCVPGCKEFKAIGKDEYRIVLSAAVAAVSGSFTGTVSMADVRPRVSYVLHIEGKGAPGFANGSVLITLTPREHDVSVDVAGSVTIGGVVAQVGQRLLGATARMMMEKFFGCLQRKI
jgi:carbon monoxide dehydrogenase subunit G